MRICVMAPFGSIHTQRWVRYFVERGHDVHGLTYEPVETPLDGVTFHALVPRRPSQPSRLLGEARAAGWKTSVPFGVKVAKFGMQWLAHGLRRAVRAIRPDILHGHFIVEHAFYAALSGFSPLAVSAWGSDIMLHPWTSPINRLLVSYVLQRSALIHSLSPVLSEQIQRLGVPAERILTAPFGVEESLLQVRAAPSAGFGPVLMNMKSLGDVYNFPTLIRAVALVRARHPGLVLRLLGDGPMRGELERLTAALDLSSCVEFLGVVPRPRLLELLSGAAAFVSPSFSEGSSVSLLEAMAVGVIPVVSDIPANREWVVNGQTGFLAPPADAEALAEAIHAALTQPEAWRQQAISRNKAIIRDRAIWPEQMRRIETAYQELVR